jgi:hypothetical protein
LVEFVLRHAVIRAFLAGVDLLGVRPRQSEYAFGNQMVVDDGIRLADQAGGAQRQQVEVTRAAADDVDGSD